MSKKKGKLRIRRAKPGDKALAMKLWEEYLGTEGLVLAGGAPPTEHNMEVFGNVFDAYVTGEFDGVVLLHAEDAILIWGDPGSQVFESKYGRQAQGWGVYVRESHRGAGVATALQKKAVNILRDMGFDTVCGNVDPEDRKSYEANLEFGFKPGILVVHYDMKED
jgi:GNAT superfamily N-acetyltransferase